MPFIVEDGSGLPDANAYISVAEANSYFATLGNSVWSSKTAAERRAAIVQATAYLDGNFYWVGHIKFETQSLGWPRSWAFDYEGREIPDNIVPQRVKDATAQLALEALDKPLSPSLVRGGDVKRQKVGSLEIEYFEGANDSRTFPIIGQILGGLFKNNQPTIELFRA